MSVSETPVIEAFVEVEDDRVLQNEVVEFSGSFTRPQGLSNVRYQWDFGDGTSPEEGEVAEGITCVDTTHAYADYRSSRYRARFTITADSEVGEIVSSHEIRVRVDEDPGLIVGGFDLSETAKTSVGALSIVVSGLTTVAIWAGIFAVVWAPLAVVVVIMVRRGRRVKPVVRHRRMIRGPECADCQRSSRPLVPVNRRPGGPSLTRTEELRQL